MNHRSSILNLPAPPRLSSARECAPAGGGSARPFRPVPLLREVGDCPVQFRVLLIEELVDLILGVRLGLRRVPSSIGNVTTVNLAPGETVPVTYINSEVG